MILNGVQRLEIDPIPLKVSLAATGGLYYTTGSLFADTQKSQAEKAEEWRIMLWVAFKIYYCKDILAPNDYKPSNPEDQRAFSSSFKAVQNNPEKSKTVFGQVLADDNSLKNMNQYLLALALYSQKIRFGMFVLALEKLTTKIEDLFFNFYNVSVAKDDKNFLMDIGSLQRARNIFDYQDETVRDAANVEIKEKLEELKGVISEEALNQLVKDYLNQLEKRPSDVAGLSADDVRNILKASKEDPGVAAFLENRLKRMLITFIKNVPEDKNSENYQIVSELLNTSGGSESANQSRAKGFLDQCCGTIFSCALEQQKAETYVLAFQEKLESMATSVPNLKVDSFNHLSIELNEKAQDIKKRVDEHKLEQSGNEPHYYEAIALENVTDYLSEDEAFTQKLSAPVDDTMKNNKVEEKQTYRPD